MTYISLFSCAGIGCYGFKQEGFECITTIEIDKKRLAIQKYNNKCSKDNYYIDKDIRLKETQEQIKINLSDKELDVLIATPPCQGMSTLNTKKTEKDIHRNSLVVTSINLVNEYKPKIFIFENVRSFLKTLCLDNDKKLKTIKKAIESNLNEYNIEYQIINFKDYGANSSRTRTLVIGVRKDLKINPLFLFPKKQRSKTLYEIIGKLPSLKRNEISKDILHFSKKMNDKHYLWMKNTPMGKSAFDNIDKNHIPHKIVNNNYILFNNSIGGKYSRNDYNKVKPCIHTYTNNPASQWTIHPIDTRVLSIRELMLLMNIPEEFKWDSISYEELNKLPIEAKEKWLKKNERIVRTMIGESVPTIIFQEIAKNIKSFKWKHT